jgi:hypothetical protein
LLKILFTGLSNYCRKAIGKQPPQKASPFLIEIAWRMTHCELDFLIEKKINAGCSNSSYTNTYSDERKKKKTIPFMDVHEYNKANF